MATGTCRRSMMSSCDDTNGSQPRRHRGRQRRSNRQLPALTVLKAMATAEVELAPGGAFRPTAGSGRAAHAGIHADRRAAGAGQHALRAPGGTRRAAAGACPYRRTAREHAIGRSR